MDSPRGAQRQAVQAAQCEPTGVVARSACHASGDFCDARLTRAPEETGESLGSPFFGYFIWRSKESDWPRAATERAGGKPTISPKNKFGGHQFAAGSARPTDASSWFDKLTTNGYLRFAWRTH